MIDFRKYRVWQKSHSLVLEIYALTRFFPREEQFGIVSQINRAAVSIPTNIAEGCGRSTQKELIRFLYISSGSAHELEYLIFLSKELGFTKEEIAIEILLKTTEIKKMLSALINKVAATA